MLRGAAGGSNVVLMLMLKGVSCVELQRQYLHAYIESSQELSEAEMEKE